jgi:RIO kinase 1
MQKRSKHGRAQDEAAWRSTEVDMIHRLHAAGVRVPVPMHFVDGVLLMELITDAEGNPAPRLADLVFEPSQAQAMYDRLMLEVQRMLCAGVAHGDLSDFNVLVGADGPVIIDFPQSVDTAHNTNARKLLLRDVENLHRFLKQFAPNARRFPYAEEMWDLFQQNALTPDTRLTGRYRPSERRANTGAVLELIQDANYDERKRRESLGLRGGPPQSQPGPRNHQPQSTQGPRNPQPQANQGSRNPQPQANQGPRNPPQGQGPRNQPQANQAQRNQRPHSNQGPRNQNPQPQQGPRNQPPQSNHQGPRNQPPQRGGQQRKAPGVEVILARRPSMPRPG